MHASIPGLSMSGVCVPEQPQPLFYTPHVTTLGTRAAPDTCTVPMPLALPHHDHDLKRRTPVTTLHCYRVPPLCRVPPVRRFSAHPLHTCARTTCGFTTASCLRGLATDQTHDAHTRAATATSLSLQCHRHAQVVTTATTFTAYRRHDTLTRHVCQVRPQRSQAPRPYGHRDGTPERTLIHRERSRRVENSHTTAIPSQLKAHSLPRLAAAL